MYQVIYEELLHEIQSGKYKAGDKIMSEKEIASLYHVSRITSKQALEILAFEKKIVRRPGLGSFVADNPSTYEGKNEEIAGIKGNKIEHEKMQNLKKVIAVIFDSFDYAYGCELLQGIERECSRKGIRVLLRCTYGNIEAERESIKEAIDDGVAGLIVMCVHNEVFDEQILRCVLDDFPVILVDRNMAKVAIPCVSTDNLLAAKEMTEELLNKGHKKICFVSHINHNTSTIRARLAGVKSGALERGIIVDDSMCFMEMKTCTPIEKEGVDTEYAKEDEEKMIQFIQKNPDFTAYFASQYKIGLIVMKAIRALGLEQKIDVVFFDGPQDIHLDPPYYARIIQNENLIGVTAVKLLSDKMRGKKIEGDIYIPYHIIH